MSLPPFPITDAHVHLWDPARLRYGWLRGSLDRAYGLTDFDAARGPVEVGGIVFVECGVHPADAVAEAEWVSELATRDARIGAIVAQASLEDGAESERQLETLAALPLVRGVRRILQGESDPRYCLRPPFVEGVRALARYDLSFDLCIRHLQLAAAVELVRACPDVRFILDHIGKPDIKAGTLDPWRDDIRRMAELPNVSCKVSGLVTEADHDHWTADDLRPYVEHVLACFGWGRVLYGGDWPVATLATDYPRWAETLWGLTAEASDGERRALFADNARRVYGLDGSGGSPPAGRQ